MEQRRLYPDLVPPPGWIYIGVLATNDADVATATHWLIPVASIKLVYPLLNDTDRVGFELLDDDDGPYYFAADMEVVALAITVALGGETG
jgi:hypothetical protein